MTDATGAKMKYRSTVANLETVMLALSLVALAVISQTPETDLYDSAAEFIACAGFFDAAADEYADRGQPMTSEEYRGTARGARAVAEVLAFEAIPDDGRREEFLSAGYENAFVRHSAAAERDEIIPDEAQRCFDLQPVQNEILEMMRREAYLSDD